MLGRPREIGILLRAAVVLAVVLPCVAVAQPNDAARDLLASRIESLRSVRTPRVRVFHDVGLVPAHRELASLEREIDSILAALGAGPEIDLRLRRSPLRYLYTSDLDLLRAVSVSDAEGVSFPSLRLAVSLRLPHPHELVHLLVGEVVADLPAGQEPLLQEGIATLLGGNGDVAPWAVLANADRILDEREVDLSRLWTTNSFRNDEFLDASTRYALAARFVDYLRATQGLDFVLSLLRRLAGNPAEVAARPRDVILLQLEGMMERSWREIVMDFHAWRRDHPADALVATRRPEGHSDRRQRDEFHVADSWRQPDGSWVVALHALEGEVAATIYWGEAETLPLGSALAPPRRRRYSLRVAEGVVTLRDQAERRTLARWEGARSEFVEEVIVRLAPELVPLVAPYDDWSLWARPRFRSETP